MVRLERWRIRILHRPAADVGQIDGMPSDHYFTRDLFKFLSELRTHNSRKWFQKNKERYERQVRDPVLRFIADLGPGVRKINRHIVADPSPVRGSMMRIYRDIRFSKTRVRTKPISPRTFGTKGEKKEPRPLTTSASNQTGH